MARINQPGLSDKGRRLFLQGSGAAALSALVSPAASAVPSVGFLSVPPSGSSPVYEAFRNGLRELGYVENGNIHLAWRGAEGNDELLPQLAAELVSSGVKVVVAETYPAIIAAKKVTTTVPI